ncbi:MAG: zinc metalloprotease HtpX [Ignavibacteriae bacterium]|nr:zinc metalloprotease HtpX [Ignavibacteriota bacterium]
MNNMKTLILMSVLTALLIWIGSLLGGQGGMILGFVLAAAMNFGSYWFSDKIVLRMYGARELTRSEAPELFSMTEEMTRKGGLPMPKLYLIEGDQPNAFATGRDPEHAAVAVTQGIMRLMPRDELKGVIGHELAHVKHRDILIGSIAATMAGAISMIANMAQWAMIFGGRSSDDDEGHNPIAGIAMMIIAPIAAMLIQMAISRSREFLADEGGAELAGNPRSLANALKRLHSGAAEIPMHATPATAHMFIVNPLTGGGLAKLFSTHPPMEERVARLEAMSAGRVI